MISICAVRLRPLFESETSCLSPGTGHHSNTILSYSSTTRVGVCLQEYIYIYTILLLSCDVCAYQRWETKSAKNNQVQLSNRK